jgi:mannosylglycoprotein endo-beta-mannosidase
MALYKIIIYLSQNSNHHEKSGNMRKTILIVVIINTLSGNMFPQTHKTLLNENWKAKRCTDVIADGNEITSEGFNTEGWMEAVVPGTILTTLLHNHQIPDPFFGMNNTMIPDVFETGRDYYTYWFYKEFELPDLQDGEQVWLNFRGINYFADIFLNGNRVNIVTHQGMYLREKYLITPFLLRGKSNKLAVWVAPPDPVGNAWQGQGGDGTIGRNVTMQCTAGWDWICPMHDRNTGIWDQVSLEITGPVDMRNAYTETRVPGIRVPGKQKESAFVKSSVELRNVTEKNINGTARVRFGKKELAVKVTLNPREERIVSFPEIEITNPRLWWPNGMGDHSLSTLGFDFTITDGMVSDSERVSFGIRETGHYFDEKIRAQVFTINGQKVFIKGGNWIASDAMLRLSEARYEAEIHLHAGMNMNMIRVWGGGLTERPEFYNACDKQGILVWQDLWISGDCNGEWFDPAKKESQARRKSYPDNHELFLESVADQIKMLRNHPSLFLWCGGNETPPPPDIRAKLENDLFPRLDPKRFYLDKSTSSKLMTNSLGGTGDGPYGLQEPNKIFTQRSFPFNPEVGSMGIPNFDGLKKIIPENELIPPETNWGSKSWFYHKYLPLYDFPDRYGKVRDIRDYCMKAQLVGYEQYRALQEGFNYKMWDWYSGMLVWKNQNPWTALRGFFYDYFLDCTGGYFGYKHGAEPLHIQLNLNDSVVCALNQTARDYDEISAIVRLFDIHGKLISELKKIINLQMHSQILLNRLDLPKSNPGIYFARLLLTDGDRILDENFYWLTNKPGSYESLNELKKVKVKISIDKSSPGFATVSVSNPGDETAFFLRLKVTNGKDELVLPSFFSDNYITLLPGESKKIELDYSMASTGNKETGLILVAEGWNVPTQETGF